VVITRFAPSPTGFMHIGNARTALFAWLYAKHTNGKFLLRIEDTDLERSNKESIDVIMDAMEWLKLSYDGKPTFQSDRIDLYKNNISTLLETNNAYYCTCSKERLSELRKNQIAQQIKPKYDNHCRDLKLKESSDAVVRFRTPLEGTVTFKDEVYGTINVNNKQLDDLILIRSDGMPTYNLTATIDDMDMGVTHVIRGDDHINNTPKQINILKALNKNTPIYVHLPMILDENGKRLSKRHDAANVMKYKEDGILADALLNALVRLGWSHGDQEVFSTEEMIKLFELNKIHRSPASFNHEKLLWLNRQYLKTLDPSSYKDELISIISNLGGVINNGPKIEDVINLQSAKANTLVEIANSCIFLYKDIENYDETSIQTYINKNILNILDDLKTNLSKIENWQPLDIKAIIKNLVKSNNLKFPELAQPIRLALTGTIVSPSIDQTIYLLGLDKTINRLESFKVKCDK